MNKPRTAPRFTSVPTKKAPYKKLSDSLRASLETVLDIEAARVAEAAAREATAAQELAAEEEARRLREEAELERRALERVDAYRAERARRVAEDERVARARREVLERAAESRRQRQLRDVATLKATHETRLVTLAKSSGKRRLQLGFFAAAALVAVSAAAFGLGVESLSRVTGERLAALTLLEADARAEATAEVARLEAEMATTGSHAALERARLEAELDLARQALAAASASTANAPQAPPKTPAPSRLAVSPAKSTQGQVAAVTTPAATCDAWDPMCFSL